MRSTSCVFRLKADPDGQNPSTTVDLDGSDCWPVLLGLSGTLAGDFNLLFFSWWGTRSTLQALGLLVFIRSLNTPMKLSKGKGKGSDNYPYFTAGEIMAGK